MREMNQILVPELGEGVREVTFVAWLKNSGERVTAGEAVAEVMTDKINLEIEAPATGTLRQAGFGPDDVVPVGAAIGTIEE